MKKYFVRYCIETPNSIGSRKDIEEDKILGWKFNFGNNEVILYDQKQGLHADCYIEAEPQMPIEKIEEKAKTFVENILNLIDFSTSSASNSPLFISLYEATDGLINRPFKQVFYITLPERNVSLINKEIFEKIFNNFNKNENQDLRIARAISWLRKGYLEQKFIDKFVAFWTGLESINELLCDFFQINEEDRKINCKKCGNKISSISLAGIKKLFVDTISVESELFKSIRKARGKLLHGGGPIDNNFVEEIKKYIPLVRKSLIIGIGLLLSLDDEYIKQVLEKKTKLYTERLRIILEANIKNFTPPLLDEFRKQPIFDLDKRDLLERVINKDGKVNFKTSSNFIPRNATFDIKFVDLWGDDNTAIESARFI
ncbi:MAG TPA: HEPN domain-containing protein [Candidatus Paceibacterota bacterium]|nr:HEPN domain-containing protein [Candidatus Paceibacterota bacterium]HPO68236.1 HEPN domain-containing protein [Candidatus Pacearchaeota archaeon]